MYLRKVLQNDVNILIKNLDQFDFPVPRLETCPIKASVEEDNKLIAIGSIKLVGELNMMIFTEDRIKRAKAIKLLFNEAMFQSTIHHLDQWYSFVNDNKWASIIQKHYHFNPVDRKCYTLEL